MSNTELRYLPHGRFEVRTSADGQKTVKGYLAVYNQRSVDLGGFTEIVAPGAFTNSLKANPDVRLLVNHDWAKPLARTASGTLQLRDDNYGLGFTATLPDTTYARDVAESMSRGDITGCSFGFNCDDDGDSWANTDDGVVRTLRAVTLSEGSIVTAPAYPQTSVSFRSAPADIRSLLAIGEDNDGILAVIIAKRRTY
jgi:HK97 family phage prohead protease